MTDSTTVGDLTLCSACLKIAAFKDTPSSDDCDRCFRGNWTDRRFIKKDRAKGGASEAK